MSKIPFRPSSIEAAIIVKRGVDRAVALRNVRDQQRIAHQKQTTVDDIFRGLASRKPRPVSLAKINLPEDRG
jgi:hypothetical protein